MGNQTTIFIIIAAAVLFILFLMIKNKRDRKRLITPEDGADPVRKVNTEHHNQRDKL